MQWMKAVQVHVFVKEKLKVERSIISLSNSNIDKCNYILLSIIRRYDIFQVFIPYTNVCFQVLIVHYTLLKWNYAELRINGM